MDGGGENYVFLSLGSANAPGTYQFEVKTTVNSVSTLNISNASSGEAEIQVARIGNAFLMLRRELPAGSWTVHRRYARADMPANLQVGMTVYTDWTTSQTVPPQTHNGSVLTIGNPDLVAQFDYFRFARPNVPAALAGRDLTNPAQVTDGELLAYLGANANTPAPFDSSSLPPAGYHTGSVAYYENLYFANGVMMAGNWMRYVPFQWGSDIAHWNESGFSAQGLPLSLPEGFRYRALMFATNVPGAFPSTGQPDRAILARGQAVLTWQGRGDLRLSGGTFVPDGSRPETGLVTNGRRVYRFNAPSQVTWFEVHALDAADPLTDVDVWMPDPANPGAASLEGQLWHPSFLARLREAPWGFIRTMNLTETNGNPEQDWSDRRLPTTIFQTGLQTQRSPGAGHVGLRQTGVAWEHILALANETDLDLWINIPHLASDTYIRNLALLIRYGSDGVNPYTSAQASPVYPPLEPGRRIYLEYSNEIWSNGSSFPQGDWAQERATELGISKAAFNARRFCDVWRIFQDVNGDSANFVRVAALFTAVQSYSSQFLTEMRTYGASLSPAVEPDVIAVTTYFGNGIQDWAFQRAVGQAGTDDPWFFTTESFDAGGGNMRPVSVGASDPYWSSEAAQRHINATFDEWMARLLSGDAREGAGPDATASAGGFDPWVVELARTAFPTPKPLVAYEGGPSIYTDGYDGGDVRDDGVTTFMSMVNRSPRMREVYEAHLNMARSKGLRTHVMFTDASQYGKYGQWGHLEHLSQPNAEAHKYQFMLDWIAADSQFNHVDQPEGGVPAFVTPGVLPVARYGEPYQATATVAGGDGALALTVIGRSLVQGLDASVATAGAPSLTIAGTPTESGLSYVYTRLMDADGDADWRTYSLRTVGGPNVLLQANLEGTNPGQNLPWLPTYLTAPGLGWSGINGGAGIVRTAGNDALYFSVNVFADEPSSTLANAIAQNQYLSFTIMPSADRPLTLAGHTTTLVLRRMSYHASRRFAVFSSVGGFTEPAALLTSAYLPIADDITLPVEFPDAIAYRELTDPFEIRLYGFSGQYGGHPVSLQSLTIEGALGGTVADSWVVN